MIEFPVDYKSILQRIDQVDPTAYAQTRNHINGKVSFLSPYISRGVITLKQIKEALQAKSYTRQQVEKFLQELAWREYWQRVWMHLGNDVFTDIKHPQEAVLHNRMIKNIQDAATGIHAIDDGIRLLYKTGYMHNHIRMYVAGITCNIGKAHWLQPSRWMYFHLLDGDLASNALSWQWIAGSFSAKKYIANQENINRYLHSSQQGTFLDMPYENILHQPIPDSLAETISLELKTNLPKQQIPLNINPTKPILLYNSYNLNPEWRKDMDANRVLLLEPGHFEKYPVSDKVISFIINLATENIPGIQVFTGNIHEIPLLKQVPQIISIQHPASKHYPGTKDDYPWLFPELEVPLSSFSAFWKKINKPLYHS